MKPDKVYKMWGIFNFGRIFAVEHSRRQAIATVERETGHPWSKAKEYMSIEKIEITRLEKMK